MAASTSTGRPRPTTQRPTAAAGFTVPQKSHRTEPVLCRISVAPARKPYAFIPNSYDGGAHWTTVNATPNNPVQKEACIWNEGGANQCRNLLDFNEITKDEKGRVLYAYADGCIDDCEEGGPNSYSSKATIARQSGGKGLLSQFDPAEPAAPQAACLSGRRDDLASYLKWVTPDNGGSDITAYKIFRGTTPNNLVLIGQQVGDKNTYNDRTADPAVSN